jgi:threonine/homoserine/homoserine lactone efflux protein
MVDWLFLKAMAVGFMVAAPVGPVGVMCVRRALTNGILLGVLSGLGAASADAVYGAVAAFGLTVISDFLMQHQFWLRLVGGLLLIGLGVSLYRRQAQDGEANCRSGLGPIAAYASTFVLTASNPATIIGFGAIFAGLGLAGVDSSYWMAGLLVLGVFAGSAIWWVGVSLMVGVFRKTINLSRLPLINRLAGIAIFTFGLIAVLAAFNLKYRFIEEKIPGLG